MDAEARARVVAEIKASGESNAQAAERYGVQPGTVARWIREQSPSRLAAIEEPEEFAILQRLGRKGESSKAEVAHRKNVQVLWEWAYGALWVMVVIPLALLAYNLIPAIFAVVTGLTDSLLLSVIIGVAIGAVLVTAGSGVGVLVSFLFRLIAPYPYLYMQLHTAHTALLLIGRNDIFRRTDRRSTRNQHRREVDRSLKRAEGILASNRRGGAWSGAGARQAEREHRRNAAALVSGTEVSLHQRGPSAYDASLKLLRTLMFLTLLRDWSLNTLPRVTYKAHNKGGFRHTLWRVVQVLATLLALVAGVRELVTG